VLRLGMSGTPLSHMPSWHA